MSVYVIGVAPYPSGDILRYDFYHLVDHPGSEEGFFNGEGSGSEGALLSHGSVVVPVIEDIHCCALVGSREAKTAP